MLAVFGNCSPLVVAGWAAALDSLASLLSQVVHSVLWPTKSPGPWDASGDVRWETLKVCSEMGHPNGKCSCLFANIQDNVTAWFPSTIAFLVIFPHPLM